MNPIDQKSGFCALLIIIFASSQYYAQLLPTEAQALDDLKANISPQQWTTGETNQCLWAGVYCANFGTYDQIISLDLNFSAPYTINLVDSIGNLAKLTSIYFVQATFVSPITATLAQTPLSKISFTNCSGITFPTTGAFNNVFDNLIAAYDSSMTNLPPADVFPRLSALTIIRGNVDTTIPSGYDTLASLNDLVISHTTLRGSIPPEFGNLRCKKLLLDNNQLSGPIPAELGNLTSPNLIELNLSNNKLNGSIPSTLGNLKYITNLNLEGNQLTGPIPSSIFKSNLETLSLSGNKLTGPYPDTSQATQLSTLLVSGNAFPAGPIPSNFYSLPSLTTFDGSNNQFTGSIPTFAGPITHLYLAKNRFTGSITQFTQNSLLELDLSGNNFTGIFPNFLLNMPSLTTLNIANNYIAGCAPIDRFPQLISCNFTGNVLCCANATLACDAQLNQCLNCGTNKPAEGAVCMYNDNLVPVWLVNGNIVNTTTPIENTVVNGSITTTTNVTLSNVVINGNLSVNNAQLTVNNGIIDVRGCANINGTLVLNLTPEEAQQLATNGTLERELLMYDTTCSDVNFDQIVINGETVCTEAIGKQRNMVGLVSIVITSQQLNCNNNVQEPTKGDSTGPTSYSIPDWAIAVIVVGSILVTGAIITGVLVSRHIAQKKSDNELDKVLQNHTESLNRAQ